MDFKYIKIYYFINNNIFTYYLKTEGLNKTEIDFILNLDKNIDNQRNVEVHEFMNQLHHDLLICPEIICDNKPKKYDVIIDGLDLNYEINLAGGCPSILIYKR